MSGIGKLRERIVIEFASTNTDVEGQPIRSWSTLATVWARAEFLSGRELETLQKIDARTAVRFTIRYRTDVTALMRVTWRSSTWNIHTILPFEDRHYTRLITSKKD